MPGDLMIYSNRPCAADLPSDIGDEVHEAAPAAVIWHVPLSAEEFGGLHLPFNLRDCPASFDAARFGSISLGWDRGRSITASGQLRHLNPVP
jgi:hypothetical protein